MSSVMACIDGSDSSTAVCDYACWASSSISSPLTFLHVLDRERYPVPGDFSGSIGLGSREHLLAELAELDAQRGKVALEQGHSMLDAARARAIEDGVCNPTVRQRHGNLAETVNELQEEIRLLVIGKQGDEKSSIGRQIGSHLESVIRSLSRPILVTPITYKRPESLMVAFDGSATASKALELIATSPLFRHMPVHIVMVGPDTNDAWDQIKRAKAVLARSGFDITIAIRAGEVEDTLHAYQAEHAIDLLVMGAYGHSRIREFLVGSTTTNMLRATDTPILLLR
ncbi:MAG: universal stress protein [Pseudomonas sp.]|nr:MAG: universal stress protein [Pseudomonas sp.]